MRSPDRDATGLAALVRPLPVAEGGDAGRWRRADLAGGVRLVVAGPAMARDELMRIARVAFPGDATSRSATTDRRGVAVAASGRVGLDIETLARVALNATAGDAWLAPAERRLVAAAASPVLELACHWVLKEAYGKALGVGLALPLDGLAFGAVAGRAILAGEAAPPGSAGWRFALYRDGDALFGIARRASS